MAHACTQRSVALHLAALYLAALYLAVLTVGDGTFFPLTIAALIARRGVGLDHAHTRH